MKKANAIVGIATIVLAGGACFDDVDPPDDNSTSSGAGGQGGSSANGGGGGTATSCNSCDVALCDESKPVCVGEAQTQRDALLGCAEGCKSGCDGAGLDVTNPDDWVESGDICDDGKVGTVSGVLTLCGECLFGTDGVCKSQLTACE